MLKNPWHRRAGHALRHSLKLRMVLVFLLLAAAMAFTFISGMQKAFSLGWREAGRPLLMDYVDHLAADITPDAGQVPSIARALAITQRLPITIRIAGPVVQWQSHPGQDRPDWLRDPPRSDNDGNAKRERWGSDIDWPRLLRRTTADGHTIEFGLNDDGFERRPRLLIYTLGALLLFTLLAFLYVRRLLRPLDDIRAGALRFGAGDFGQPIPVRRPRKPDELGDLATTINAMAGSIHQMLEAKRGLLLAISHELRSPLTRARLNTELLPEDGDTATRREALLRDLREMAALVTDLLESERLGQGHAALQKEPTDLVALVREVVASLAPGQPSAFAIQVIAKEPVLMWAVDRIRMKLLVRNLLDNALRHSQSAAQPPEIRLATALLEGTPVASLTVRDHGPGVEPAALPHLAEPFYRPDTARTRATGGVGLGLHLCKLVAQAHGGSLTVHHAQPGLVVEVLFK